VKETELPYWRLSGFYFFYFTCLGILVPYLSLYLDWQGFSASQIGELTAILLASRIVAPNLWAWIADHHGQRIIIVRLTSLAAVIVVAGLFIEQSFFSVAITLLLFSFFWNASLPQFEVITLEHLGKDSHRYSRIRLWGSIGFIIIVIVLGALLEVYTPNIVPMTLMACAAGMWLMSLTVSDTSHQKNEYSQTPLKQLLKRPSVIAFLLMCFFIQASHGPYYTFYTLYLEQFSYPSGLIGQLWALGVFAEIIVFLLVHRWLNQHGTRRILLVSLLLTSLRWLLIAFFPQHLLIIILAQCLHAASYGAFHSAAIAWVHRHFTGKTQGRGQALYSSVSFGAGGAFGSLFSGYLWDTPGPQSIFVIASALSFIGFLVTLVWLKEDDRINKYTP